jgi:hypothetical protein
MSTTAITLTAAGDGANLTDGAYCGDLSGASGGATTARTNIIEVYVGGQSGASAVAIMLLARDSIFPVTSAASTVFDAPLDASTAALAQPVLASNGFSGTKPQRSTTLHLLNLTFNAFGGIVRWVAAPGEEITIIGNTASLGSVSLSCGSGGSGTVGSHVIYEPF